MPTRDTSSNRPRANKRPGGRAPRRAPPPSRAEPRRTAGDADAADQQLMQGLQHLLATGLGAISRVQKEGPAALQDTVAEGIKLLNQSRSAAQRAMRGALGNAQETLQSRMGGAREQAKETFDNVEALFQSRVQRAMHQLGVPTAEEIRLLTQRVAELNESVRRINERERTARPKAARPKAHKAAAQRKRQAPPPAPTGEEVT